jgi:hypothetical protein
LDDKALYAWPVKSSRAKLSVPGLLMSCVPLRQVNAGREPFVEFSMTKRGRFARWIPATVLCVAFGAMAPGCANSDIGTATTPSGVAPAPQNAASVKQFAVSMSPMTLPAGSGAIVVTVTNTGSGSAAGLGSVQITLQAGLTPVSTSGFSGSKSWYQSSISGGVVTVGATIGTQKLDPAESVSFTLNVSSSECTQYVVTSVGSNETPTTFAPSGWTNTAGTITISVNGCTAECAAAPAVANAYLDSIGFTGARGDIDSAVALHMTRGARFDGIEPCDVAAYRQAVVAFLHANFGV